MSGKEPETGILAEESMTNPDDLAVLEARHAALEQEIHDESRRPLPNQTHLTDLKRRKLQIKEQIERMSAVNSPA